MVTQGKFDTVAEAAKPIPLKRNSKGVILDPNELLAAGGHKVNFERIETLANRSVISANQFDRDTVIELCKFGCLLEFTEIAEHHPLDGKLVITAFFEASTRTRLSFESSVLRLDGKVLSVPDGKVTGVAKGESLADIGEMFNTYGDLVIMRHPETDSIRDIRTNLERPLINAGNGSGEHPTQALVDWYTLLKWRPELIHDDTPEDRKLHLGVVGTPGSMRAVKSFVFMALLFAPGIRRITIVSEMADPLGVELQQAVEESSIDIQMTNNIADVITDLDVVYMNSIAFLGDSYKTLDSRFKLDKSSPLKNDAVILHPFARRDELDTNLDATGHNLYFAQAASAVYIRQALLICVLGRLTSLPFSVLYLTRGG